MKKVALITALFFFAACDEKQGEVVETKAATDAAVAAEADVGARSDAIGESLNPFEGTTIYGSPHDEEHREIEIRFNGQAGEVLTLYRNPGSTTSAAGKLKPEPGEQLQATDSLVFVRESRRLIATRDTRFPATDYFPSSNKFGKDRLLSVERGEAVHLLKRAAEGTCFLGYDTQTYHAPCPSTDDFDWDGQHSADGLSWWVLVTDAGARGWLEVDGQSVRHEMVEAKK